MNVRGPDSTAEETESRQRESDLVEDPAFDLKKGLIVLVILVSVVVMVTMLCILLARQ